MRRDPIPFREGMSANFRLRDEDDIAWSGGVLVFKPGTQQVQAIHRVPRETFMHYLDVEGECICGPEGDVLGWVDYEENVPMWWHQALDKAYYPEW